MSAIVRFNVAVTDGDWFTQLAAEPNIDEVNFWQPSASGVADPIGTPWLFKLKAPRNVIAGGGFFVHFTSLTTAIAWREFGRKNGVPSLEIFRERVRRYTRKSELDSARHEVGCVVLAEPFFFTPAEQIPVPTDWKPNIVRGRHYGIDDPFGRQLWQDVVSRISTRPAISALPAEPLPAYGQPILVSPRLGQGAFRTTVLDAYGRRCAVTGERTLPVVEAAHIKPYALTQNHQVSNGLALRSDLHTLFDLGYVTVTPSGIFRVSKSIKAEFANGREYYSLDGKEVRKPEDATRAPDRDFLDWHASEIFLG